MNYFKIGCRWDAKGEDHNHMQGVFQKYQAIFIDQKTYDYPLNCMNKAKPDDRVAIADGKKIVGVAIIKSYEMSLNQMNIPKEIQEEDPHKFEHHKHANYQQYNVENALGFRALVMLFKETSDNVDYEEIIDDGAIKSTTNPDKIDYGNIGAFRHVADSNLIIRNHIDAMCKKYNMLP